jgi:transglutaminase-like putative cysteine protease
MFSLFIPSSFASNEDVFYIDSMEIQLDINSKINLIRESSASTINYVQASLSFYPEESWRQSIYSSEISPNTEPVDGTLIFRWNYPKEDILEFDVNSKIRTYNKFKEIKLKSKFPIENLDKEYEKYTEATELIDINQGMIKLATDIAEGEDDLYVVVNNIAAWVNKNIEYNLSTFTVEASRESSWVLENRIGVCDEITNLFISMCRSIGIPARFVSGYAYTNSPLFGNDWGAHGWAEVYFPNQGWVPFDVTYSQLGYIDAGHIKFNDDIDSSKNMVSYEWKGSNIKIEPQPLDITTTILKKGNILDEILEITAKPLSEEIGFGSYNLIEATLENNEDYYITADVILIAPAEVDVLNDNKKFVTLEPKSSGKAYWIVKIPNDLNRNSVYTFPFLIKTLRNQTHYFDFKSSYYEINLEKEDVENILNKKLEEYSKEYSKKLELSCSSKDEIKINKTLEINCLLENNGNVNLRDLKVCLEDECVTKDILLMQHDNVVFEKTFHEEGEKILTIDARNDDVLKTESLAIVVYDKPKIEINNIKHPEKTKYEETFIVSFELEKSSFATPKDIDIILQIRNIEQQWSLDKLNENRVYDISVKGSDLGLGDNKGKIITRYYDDKEYTTEREFSIMLEDVTLIQKIIIYFKQFIYKIFS